MLDVLVWLSVVVAHASTPPVAPHVVVTVPVTVTSDASWRQLEQGDGFVRSFDCGHDPMCVEVVQ